ncbi:MAG: tripartite tricarboxylate transporter substrate binding protein [Xanthobacteraceae bacterium]|jgi:tripartite-type tricarboxylate transporter receptor subunit TctC
MLGRKAIGLLCIAALCMLPVTSRAAADNYPSRPIHLIITTPAGSLIDLLGRVYAQELGAQLGQPVVVDNRPGAMTLVGTEDLVRADPDGYTLMIGPSELTMLPVEKKNYPYDPTRDITPVALVTTSWTVFAINPKLPPQTLPEFIAYAKARPGKLHYGTNGVGGALHIAVEMLKLKTGIDIIHVPYRGGEQAANDAIAGQIEMVSMGLASARVAEGGRLRILAQTGPIRHPLFPDVPTTAEVGLPDVRMDTWFGLVAPPKTPAAIVERLDRATAAVEQEQIFRDKLARIGCVPAYKSHADFAAFIAADLKKWQKLIPALGIPQIE